MLNISKLTDFKERTSSVSVSELEVGDVFCSTNDFRFKQVLSLSIEPSLRFSKPFTVVRLKVTNLIKNKISFDSFTSGTQVWKFNSFGINFKVYREELLDTIFRNSIFLVKESFEDSFNQFALRNSIKIYFHVKNDADVELSLYQFSDLGKGFDVGLLFFYDEIKFDIVSIYPEYHKFFRLFVSECRNELGYLSIKNIDVASTFLKRFG